MLEAGGSGDRFVDQYLDLVRREGTAQATDDLAGAVHGEDPRLSADAEPRFGGGHEVVAREVLVDLHVDRCDRVAVARGGINAGADGQSALFYEPGLGGNQRDSTVKVFGIKGGSDKFLYKFRKP